MDLPPIIKHSIVNIGIVCTDTNLSVDLISFWLSMDCKISESYHKIFWIKNKPVQININIIDLSEPIKDLHIIVHIYVPETEINKIETDIRQIMLIFDQSDIVDLPLTIPCRYVYDDDTLKTILDEITHDALLLSIKMCHYYNVDVGSTKETRVLENIYHKNSNRECMLCNIF